MRRDEIKAKPYISPSHMEMLMKQAAEEERIRKLLLADDFRERALMAMMNGVLEVRWEDIIKIDVPKPACMLTKKPEDYTSEDILAVKQYEKDVQFLKEERERYHRMLDAEYSKVMEQLKEGIDKFNGKLNNLFHVSLIKLTPFLSPTTVHLVFPLSSDENERRGRDQPVVPQIRARLAPGPSSDNHVRGGEFIEGEDREQDGLREGDGRAYKVVSERSSKSV